MLKLSASIVLSMVFGLGGLTAAEAAPAVKNVVLVHGGFVDGSGWKGVYDILSRDGYKVTVVQNPTVTLDGDVAVTRLALAEQDGPAILVGHSYGGVVITEAGNDAKVAGLVYVAAFAPDRGESVAAIISHAPPGAPQPPILPPKAGFLFLDRAGFPAAFAADVKPDLAAFMAASQVPWGVGALQGQVNSEPAWKAKPSWFLVTGDDHMLPAPAQLQMAGRAHGTVVQVSGNHAIYLSNPRAVAKTIEQAAEAASK